MKRLMFKLLMYNHQVTRQQHHIIPSHNMFGVSQLLFHFLGGIETSLPKCLAMEVLPTLGCWSSVHPWCWHELKPLFPTRPALGLMSFRPAHLGFPPEDPRVVGTEAGPAGEQQCRADALGGASTLAEAPHARSQRQTCTASSSYSSSSFSSSSFSFSSSSSSGLQQENQPLKATGRDLNHLCLSSFKIRMLLATRRCTWRKFSWH